MPLKSRHKMITIFGVKCGGNIWSRILIIELIINLTLSGVLVVVIIFWRNQEKPDTQLKQNIRYCVPSMSISLNADEDNENFRHFEPKDNLQCSSDDNDVPALVMLSVEKKRRQKIASGLLSEVPRSCEFLDDQTIGKGSAKVVGLSALLKGNNIPDRYLTILHWDREKNRSFIGSDVEYRNGSLVIGRSAFYFVYSQITFNQSLESDDKDEFKTFVHLIYKHSDPSDRKYDLRLLESSKSLCRPNSKDCTGFSHVSSVFFLKKSEELSVRVNRPTRVLSSPYGNFFGIYPVS